MGGNAKLGWATAGAIAWAYLGLLAALGPGVREGRPPLKIAIGHPPGSIVIPGRLLALKERGGLIELEVGTPSGEPTPIKVVPRQPPESPPDGGIIPNPGDWPGGTAPELEPKADGLPPDVKVVFVRAPGGEARKPKLQLESGARPFRLPGGGAGVMAGNYLVHLTAGEIRLVPREVLGEKLRERMKERRDVRRPHGSPGMGQRREERVPPMPPPSAELLPPEKEGNAEQPGHGGEAEPFQP